jgi:histidine ammonia-lyase
MGTTAARGARDILRNAQYVLAMELFTSLQAIDLREKLKLGKGTKVVYDYARGLIPFIDNDTIMYPHINISKDIVKSNKLVELVEKEIGCLGGIYETK